MSSVPRLPFNVTMEQEELPGQSHKTDAIDSQVNHHTVCLNCGVLLSGEYCSQCGQKKVEPHEPFWKLIAEFASDFFHFDSRFFKTFFPLLFRPGFLTLEYVKGKRVSYVHPIRLYFFVSVLFFLSYFSLGSADIINTNFVAGTQPDSSAKAIVDMANDSIKNEISGNDFKAGFPGATIHLNTPPEENDAADLLPATIEAYNDSIKKLPKDSMPGFFQQIVDRRSIEVKEKGGAAVMQEVFEAANHELPKAMFILLPVFALLLKMLYIRRRVYFEDHAVFSLHFHSFAFILFLLVLIIKYFFVNAPIGGWVLLILMIYLVAALRNVHKQRYLKTISKVLLLFVFYGFSIGITMIFLIAYAAALA